MSVLFFLLLFSFLASFALTPVVARWALARGFRGRDLHKRHTHEVAEQGGVGFFSVFLAAALVYAALEHPEPWYFLALAAGAAMALLGYADRLRRLGAAEKLGLPALLSLPVAFYLWQYGAPTAVVLLTPLLFTSACNFTNMLAGFNGLEAGVNGIATLALGAAALLSAERDAAALLLLLGAAMLGFLPHNFYPARVFPGDVGTLPVGAVMFVTAAFSGMLAELVLVLLPHTLDAMLKFASAGIMTRESQKPTLLVNDKLHPPPGGNLSLPRLLLRLRPMHERTLVLCMYGIELAAAALAVVLVLLRP